MQSNRVLVPLYSYENISERSVKIFHRGRRTQRNVELRLRVLKKASIHTAEQASVFENLFELAYPGFINALKRDYPLLSGTERIFLALSYINLPEHKIARNMGFTIEEIRRHLFVIRQKLGTSLSLNEYAQASYSYNPFQINNNLFL